MGRDGEGSITGARSVGRERSALRISNSGLVFLPRMPDIIRLRVAGSTTSAKPGLRPFPERSEEVRLHMFGDGFHSRHHNRIAELAIGLGV